MMYFMTSIELYHNRRSSAGFIEGDFKEPGLLLGEMFMNGYLTASRIRGAIPGTPWRTENRGYINEDHHWNRNVRNLKTILPPSEYSRFQAHYFGTNPPPPEMAWATNYWITDHPRVVFGEGDVYTVTSSLAVKNLMRNIFTD